MIDFLKNQKPFFVDSFGVQQDFPPKKTGNAKKVLLLQGPVGLFFSKLHTHLEANGLEVWRVCFNAGDLLFSSKKNRLNFKGDLNDWEDWVSDFFPSIKFDCIVLFGSERKIHQIAREVAKKLNIRVIALEEGYFRPGFVAVEEGGNNASSPFFGMDVPKNFKPPKNKVTPKIGSGFKKMGLYAVFYYIFRGFFSSKKQRKMFHREVVLHHEFFSWFKNALLWFSFQKEDTKTINNLLTNQKKKYFLVPLQVDADSNMKEAALGWGSVRLVFSVLSSFAQQAPLGHRLVFKIHPLNRGRDNLTSLIKETADIMGVAGLVDVIEMGLLGPLAKNAKGMITINSTSGLSAIRHGIKLLLVGKALYANERYVICAKGRPNFASFWQEEKEIPSQEERDKYLLWLKTMTSKHGDFYSSKGTLLACAGVLEKLTDDSWSKKENMEPCEKLEKKEATC